MKEIIENIAKFIDLKSFVTLGLTGALIWGFCKGIVDEKDFMMIVAMVFTFYFAKKETDNSKK